MTAYVIANVKVIDDTRIPECAEKFHDPGLRQ